MLIHEDSRYSRAHADSVGEVCDFIEGSQAKWPYRPCRTMEGIYGEQSWTLKHDDAKVMRLARDGWKEGTEQVSARLLPPARERTSSWRYDMAGYLPDVPRFLGGSPDCMMRHGHPKGRTPVISLCVQVWINAIITAAQMVNYGAAVASCIDLLEQSGKRVELWAAVVQKNGHEPKRTMSASWVVKKPDEHVDFADLAFSLAHPGASRRFGWRVWERFNCTPDTRYGMGGYTPTLADVLGAPEGMLFLPGVANQYDRSKTADDALKLVMNQINLAAGEDIVELEG